MNPFLLILMDVYKNVEMLRVIGNSIEYFGMKGTYLNAYALNIMFNFISLY